MPGRFFCKMRPFLFKSPYLCGMINAIFIDITHIDCEKG